MSKLPTGDVDVQIPHGDFATFWVKNERYPQTAICGRENEMINETRF